MNLDDVTGSQIDLMSHALGANKYRKHNGFYRNYFCASRGSTDFSEWEGMVDIGLAHKRDMGHEVFYHVSEEGREFIKQIIEMAEEDNRK